jgi:hypothetical protein
MIDAAQTIETTVFAWAPFAVSIVTLLTVLVKIGRWTQRAEDLAGQAAETLKSCRHACDARAETIDSRGTRYGVVTYASKDTVATAVLTLRDMVKLRFDDTDRRLASIEKHLNNVETR